MCGVRLSGSSAERASRFSTSGHGTDSDPLAPRIDTGRFDPHQGEDAKTLDRKQPIKGLNVETRVEAIEYCGNRRPRVERLVSAWNQGTRGDADPEDGADDPLIGASAEPKK